MSAPLWVARVRPPRSPTVVVHPEPGQAAMAGRLSNRPAKPREANSSRMRRPRRHSTLPLERLEGRTLLSIDFSFALGVGCTDIRALAVANDAAGNVYVTGSFRGTADFDPSAGTTNLTSGGDHDLFAAKYSSTGTLVWAESFFGETLGSVGQGNGIALDSSGNVYITGEFSGAVNFDPGPGTFTLDSPGRFDVFVMKLNAGGGLAWAQDVAGTPNAVDSGHAIALDSSGNAYITGSFSDTATFGTITLTTGDSDNAFVAKLDGTGGFLWARNTYSTGTSNSGSASLALDSSGRIDITGFYAGTVNFDPFASNTTLTAAGNRDIFVAQLDGSGNLVWVKGIGGAEFDEGSGVAVDSANNVYTTGAFSGTVNFDPGAGTFNLTSGGDSSIFVLKLNSTGNFVWARALTIDSGAAMGAGIVIDKAGQVDTTGWFESTVNFDPGPGIYKLTSAGFEDVFVSQLDSGGNFVAAISAGGIDFDVGSGIAVNATGLIAIAGSYTGPAAFGTTTLASLGMKNVFVAETLPTIAAPPAPGTPVLEAASDSGLSNSDDITNVTQPVFDVAPAGSANTVELLRDGIVVDSRTGPGAITDPGPLSDGTHNYTARQTNAAGQTSALSGTLTVTIDTTPPTTPSTPALLAADDSGIKGDGITNVAQPHLVGTAEAGSLAQILDASSAILGAALVAGDGTYSVRFSSALADGTYAVRVRSEDVAGNFSAGSFSFTLTIETTPPAAPALPALLASDDTGVKGDGITSVKQPHLVGSAEAGALIQIINASNTVLGAATVAPDSSYSVQLASPLNDGTYFLRVRAQDVAGNLGNASPAFTLTIDSTPPATPAAPALLAADDSGTKGDGITNVSQPHLVGSSVAGATIQIVNAAAVVLGAATVASDGTYSVQFASSLSDGTYTVQVRAQDVAGNLSAPSPSIALEIETTPPATPAAPALLAADDSGTKGDGITNVRQPHLVGFSEAGATIQIINASAVVLGAATVATDGSYSVQFASPLSDGP